MNAPFIRLTSLAHGGGCGCKLAPSVLQQLLAGAPAAAPFKHLIVGTETGDDAAVWQVDDNLCIIATTDFFMPVVDDPYDFGRIAATNAISDIYAMGGQPVMALAILGMPLDKLPLATVRLILQGGEAVCATAGIPIAGGHSIDSPEPIYGLVAIGTCRPENVRRNADARAGDAIILTKALGVGVYSAALKKGELTGSGYSEMIASTTLLNRIGSELALDEAVHAMTDVTGFGLIGHGLEMAKGSSLSLALRLADLPFLTEAERFAKGGLVTGASKRNWASYGESARLPAGMEEWRRHLLTDPQTSGGLLVSCAADRSSDILRHIVEAGYPAARIIGRAEAGEPVVRVV
jgi:selenide,water dikinase